MAYLVTFALLGTAILMRLRGKKLTGFIGSALALGHWLGVQSSSAAWNLQGRNTSTPTWAELSGDARQHLILVGVAGMALIFLVSLFDTKKD